MRFWFPFPDDLVIVVVINDGLNLGIGMSGHHDSAEAILRPRPESFCPLGERKPRWCGAFLGGRYWARTSDPQLVELVLSQLS